MNHTRWGTTTMTSSKPNYLPKVITLKVGASTHEFGAIGVDGHVQFIPSNISSVSSISCLLLKTFRLSCPDYTLIKFLIPNLSPLGGISRTEVQITGLS